MAKKAGEINQRLVYFYNKLAQHASRVESRVAATITRLVNLDLDMCWTSIWFFS